MARKGSVQLNSKWGEVLDRFVALDMEKSFFVDGDLRYARNLRTMLSVTNRTCKWKASVTHAGNNLWRVAKVGYWV